MLFDENYALASTQSLKNKDIPEGGSKGTILPSCVPVLSFFFVILMWGIDLAQAPDCASRNTLMCAPFLSLPPRPLS